MRRPARLHYAWIVFVTAFVTLLGAAGFRSTPGILIDPRREEFGWSRATVGINVALFGFIGPFAVGVTRIRHRDPAPPPPIPPLTPTPILTP